MTKGTKIKDVLARKSFLGFLKCALVTTVLILLLAVGYQIVLHTSEAPDASVLAQDSDVLEPSVSPEPTSGEIVW